MTMGKMLAVATAAVFVAFGAADAAKAADTYAPQWSPYADTPRAMGPRETSRAARQHRYPHGYDRYGYGYGRHGYDRYGYDQYGYDGWPADRRYAAPHYAFGDAIPWADVGQPFYMSGDYDDYF
jgi:hypothetical protein